MLFMIFMSLMGLILSFWMNFYLLKFLMILFIMILLLKIINLQMFYNLYFFLDFNQLSMLMIFLSMWIILMMFIYENSKFNLKINLNLKMLLYFLMFMFLLLFFLMKNIFYFYIFYEGSLVPIMMMVFMNSNQKERIKAGFYLLFYTLFLSLPMLIFILMMNINMKNLNYNLLFLMNYKILSTMLSIFVMFMFLVKMPMYLFHYWLPKAHVEAPLTGSMILAGVLLKMGGYGIMKFLVFLIQKNFNKIFSLVILLSLVGSLKLSLVCVYQMDVKCLIAFSSVCHMALVICGLFTMNYFGFNGSLILMLGHGLVSSNLFFMANTFYERYNSRNFFVINSKSNFSKSLNFWWFIFIALNLAVPPSMNFFGEIFLIMSLIKFNIIFLFFLMMLSIFSVAYSIYFYTKLFHGKFFYKLFILNLMKIEILMIFLHFLPLFVFLMNFKFFML